MNPQQKKNLVIAAVVIGVLLLGLVGKMLMRKAGERVMDGYIEGRTGVDIDRNGGSTTYTDAEGNKVTYSGDADGTGTVKVQGADGTSGSYEASTGADAKLPAEFPSDFPQMSGATLLSAYGGMEGTQGDRGFQAVWQTDLSVSEAVTFYKAELVKSGWKVVTAAEMGTQTLIAFERDSAAGGDKDGGAISVGAGTDGKTTVTVTLGLHGAR